MYELIQTGPQSFYIQAPAKIGIYKATETEVYLIDSGNDKDAGRKVRKHLDQNGWTLKGILNTHSNADHIGGNHYLQQQYGCKIFSSGIEAAFTRFPVLEPAFLYGGYPFQDLRHKFLMAAASEVSELTDAAFPNEVEIIQLPGHFFDMVGYRTPDNTVFLADCLSSAATLDKYQLTFLYDVKACLDTLDMVAGMDADWFVPAHADATTDIRPLALLNKNKILAIAAHIKDLCREPVPFEVLLKQVFDDYRLQMSYEQYVLIGSTLRSYLSWLKDSGAIEGVLTDNMLLWKSRTTASTQQDI